jgi:uncharacterized RmlC-like cupin family protein
VPPGGRARAHGHATRERAIHRPSGRAVMVRGDRLQRRKGTVAGDLICIPADLPHLPTNPGPEPVTAVSARSGPDGRESVLRLPAPEAVAAM